MMHGQPSIKIVNDILQEFVSSVRKVQQVLALLTSLKAHIFN